MQQIARKVLLSENSSMVSAQWRPGMITGILKLMKIKLGITSSCSRQPPETHLTLNGQNIPFVNSVRYLGVIFDKKVTWRLHIEMIEAKAFRTYVRI
jgi:hypothetical protein